MQTLIGKPVGDGQESGLDAGVLEPALQALAQAARKAGTSEAYAEMEDRMVRLLQPLGRTLARRHRYLLGHTMEGTCLSLFNGFLLDTWRQWVGNGAGIDPDQACVEELVAYFNNQDAGDYLITSTDSKRGRLEKRTRLKELHLDPVRCSLKHTSAVKIAKVAAHPGLHPDWKTLLARVKPGEPSGFDPAKGGFVDYVSCRFRWKMRDFLRQERGLMGQTREESRFWARESEDRVETDLDWISDPSSQRDATHLEARIELDSVLGRLGAAERDFFLPFLSEQVVNMKELADHWGITPPAVLKRLRKIQHRLGILPGAGLPQAALS